MVLVSAATDVLDACAEFVPVVVGAGIEYGPEMQSQIQAMQSEKDEGAGWFVVEFHTKKSHAAVHLMGRNNVCSACVDQPLPPQLLHSSLDGGC
jgi:hypothetical protein